MLRKCGLWCAFVVLVASVISTAQLVKDDQLMIVVPDSSGMSADEIRPAVDHQHHRRQRNATRLLVGTLTRRTSLAQSPPAVDHRPTQEVSPENAAESSVSRVKKKIKQKRTWDEPEAQASEVLQNTTTSNKRPDRIKTRRRLVQVPSSSTARALRTVTVPAVQSPLQDDPYYDFGKKIRHVPSSSTVGVVDGSSAVESEVRTLIKPTKTTHDDDRARAAGAGVDVPQAPVAAVRIRTMQQQQQQQQQPPSNHRGVHPNGPRRSTATTPSDECTFPRFIRRNNSSKTRSQRDLTTRCMPGPTADSDATRTTRILSTVVTSVSSVVKGVPNQKKNETVTEITDDTDDDYQPTPSSSGHPKYFRNRYRNITLPEYLEITRVNQRRLNNSNNNNNNNNSNVTIGTTEAVIRSTFAKVTVAPSSSSTEVTAAPSSTVGDDGTEMPVDGDPTTVDVDDDDDSRSLPIDGHPSSSSSSSSSLPPTDLQDFIYLQHNRTSTVRLPAVPAVVVDHTIATEARQRRPSLSPSPPPLRNHTGRPSTEHDVGVVYPDGLAVSTYLLTFLAVVPLVLVIAFAFRLAVRRKKKKVFDSSEYSSEYNRSPLDFNTITSSPITTKLPRVPQHIVWDAEKAAASAPAGAPAQPTPPGANGRWEFPRDKLRLQTILGQGNFGQVWKAEADDISGHEGLTRLVAVKMVKEDAASREREDLIRELSIMQHLGSHPNVVTLLGCCTEKEPYLLIMEYVMYGKLLAFLRDRRTRTHYFNFSDSTASLTSRDLTVFAYCVARGMDFLVSKKIVHRDLAARNILVDHNKLCKIADFGMSRNVRDTNQIYEQRHTKGALPIRWMAPESLHYSIFTYKTDVWSFGVLMWEIVTLGSTPYCTMGAREVMRRVREGYRLDKPAHCRSELFRVITKCWAADPSKRPTFAELKQELGALLENPEFEGSYVDLESLVDESDSAAKDRQ